MAGTEFFPRARRQCPYQSLPHTLTRCGRTHARAAGSYYEIIGVASGAEAGEIKTAYRKLAKELHPDVNPSPEALQKFIEVTTA